MSRRPTTIRAQNPTRIGISGLDPPSSDDIMDYYEVRDMYGSSETCLRDENLKRLSSENKCMESIRHNEYLQKSAKHVDNFLNSLEKSKKSQLSRSQLVKSVDKVYRWIREHRKYMAGEKVIAYPCPQGDCDSTEYSERCPSPSIRESSQTAIIDQPYLSSSCFIEERLPLCPTMQNQKINVKREISVKEWLDRRSRLLDQKHSLDKWIQNMLAENSSLSTDELFQIYSKRNEEFSVKQLEEMYEIQETSTMSINDILTAYRKEVPILDTDCEYDSDSDSNPPMVWTEEEKLPSPHPPKYISNDRKNWF